MQSVIRIRLMGSQLQNAVKLDCHKTNHTQKFLRPPRGVCEAHLHQAYKPCVIGAIQSQT